VEEIGTFPFEEIMYGKTPPAFEPNIQTSKDMSVKPTFFKGTCPLE